MRAGTITEWEFTHDDIARETYRVGITGYPATARDGVATYAPRETHEFRARMAEAPGHVPVTLTTHPDNEVELYLKPPDARELARAFPADVRADLPAEDVVDGDHATTFAFDGDTTAVGGGHALVDTGDSEDADADADADDADWVADDDLNAATLPYTTVTIGADGVITPDEDGEETALGVDDIDWSIGHTTANATDDGSESDAGELFDDLVDDFDARDIMTVGSHDEVIEVAQGVSTTVFKCSACGETAAIPDELPTDCPAGEGDT